LGIVREAGDTVECQGSIFVKPGALPGQSFEYREKKSFIHVRKWETDIEEVMVRIIFLTQLFPPIFWKPHHTANNLHVHG
jgi:hypothetical protein